MEFKTRDNHIITIDGDTNMTMVTRVRCSGGIPYTIILEFELDVSLTESMRKIRNICLLDDTLFKMLAEHTKK